MLVFIEGVRAEPCLWNPLHPQYREMQLKDEAWQRVIEHYNHKSVPNIQSAKLEWKKLRDNHRDALKRAKLGKNKLLPAQITTWKYAKAMQFLEPYMKYRITENIELTPTSLSEITLKNSDQLVSTTEVAATIPTAPKIVLKRRLSPQETEPPKPCLPDRTDALESFFKSMLDSTREMPLWLQTQVKKKIFSVIIEAEESLSSQVEISTKPDFGSMIVDGEPLAIKTEVFDEYN